MATYTENYNLIKPEGTDFYNIDDFNENADAIDSALKEVAGTTLTATLSAGETSIVFSDSAITDLSTIDFYTDRYGVNPTDAIAESGTLTLTFKEQESNVNVKVVIRA